MLVRNQSNVAESLVLKFTNCLTLFGRVKSFSLRSVEVELKSPTTITSEFGW